MSTRACYTFKDKVETFHVYKHSDGYPSGAEKWIRKAAVLAWQMPRFEASEFGAAFIAANKQSSGGCYLMPTGDINVLAPGDLAYRYEIEAIDGGIWVTVFRTPYNKTPYNAPSEQLWRGHINDMSAWIETTKQN